MSNRIDRNKDFISLLLSTDTKQKKALLAPITDVQVNALTEIFYNLDVVLPLSRAEEKVLKNKPFIHKLTNIPSSETRRRAIVKRHYHVLLKILTAFADKLLTIL